MALKDYDIILDMVEENILQNKDVISGKVCRKLGYTERTLADFFKSVDESSRALKQYIRDRRVLHAAEDFANGLTKEMVCEKYNLDESNFSKFVKRLEGKSPIELRKKGYICPKPKYLRDIIGSQEPNIVRRKSDGNENAYIEEIKRLIDENINLKTELSAERGANILMHREVTDINNITETYNEFLRIEDARIIYGLKVPEILKLYQKSLLGEKTLIQLCSEAIESFEFEIELEPMPDKLDLMYHEEDEMDIGEAYDYYCGDDDPYEPSYDPWETPEYRKYELYESYTDMWDIEEIEEKTTETEQDFEFEEDMIDTEQDFEFDINDYK